MWWLRPAFCSQCMRRHLALLLSHSPQQCAVCQWCMFSPCKLTLSSAGVFSSVSLARVFLTSQLLQSAVPVGHWQGTCRPFLHTVDSSIQQHSAGCFSFYICQKVVHSALFPSRNLGGSLALTVISRPAPRRPGFDRRPVRVGFVVDRVAMGQVLSRLTSVFSCQLHSNNSPYPFSNVLRPLYELGSWQRF